MAAKEYLDKDGLTTLWSKIKSYVATAISGKIDTAGTGLSKSGTTLNHSNSVTAKATQAVYPIKFDAQGHITGAGSAVTIPSAEDYVTAQGTSGDWRYRKWNSGKIEAWFEGSMSGSTSYTSVGSIYRGAWSTTIPTAVGFTAAPKIIVGMDNNATVVFALNGTASSKTAISGYFFRANNSTTAFTLYPRIYAWQN